MSARDTLRQFLRARPDQEVFVSLLILREATFYYGYHEQKEWLDYYHPPAGGFSWHLATLQNVWEYRQPRAGDHP
jgi:hypothetical protein